MTTSINNKSQKNQNQIDKSDSFSSCSVEIKNKICDESQKPLKISIQVYLSRDESIKLYT